MPGQGVADEVQMDEVQMDQVKPRILLLANNIDEVGGAQRVVHVLAQGFGERGHDVTLIGVVPHDSGFSHDRLLPLDIEPAYRSERLRSTRMPPAPKVSRARLRVDPSSRRDLRMRAEAEAAAVRRLQAILDVGPSGIVITAQLWAMEFLARCDLGDRTRNDHWRVIGQYHSSFEAAARGRDLDRARAVYRDVDLLLALTAEDASQLTEAGFANAGWMENPLASWPSVLASAESRTVVYLGRFSGEKAPLLLLQAWESAQKMAPAAMAPWSLELVGSGPQDQAVRQAAAKHRGVRVQGATTDPASVLAGAGMVVVPSLDEGFPLVLAEAMATGVACIASDCSAGVRALVQDGETGLLFERGNPEHLAMQIAALAASTQDRSRLGRQARHSVERLRINRIMDKWEERLAQVLR